MFKENVISRKTHLKFQVKFSCKQNYYFLTYTDSFIFSP